ncbi:MAG: DUF4390 domain-containing protein [Pseudomonadota bacterium]
MPNRPARHRPLHPGPPTVAPSEPPGLPACAGRRQALRRLLSTATLLAAPALVPGRARAQSAGNERGGVELTAASVARTEDGVLLSFAVRIELPRLVEDALLKGVPLFFEADARLWRYRWYWRDEAVAHVSRTWRLSWQPLTRDWRVGFGGLQQRYGTLAEALAAMSRGTRWKLSEPLPARDDDEYYVEFAWRLDTAQLSRPLQVGLSGQSEWDLAVQRRLAVPEAGR